MSEFFLSIAATRREWKRLVGCGSHDHLRLENENVKQKPGLSSLLSGAQGCLWAFSLRIPFHDIAPFLHCNIGTSRGASSRSLTCQFDAASWVNPDTCVGHFLLDYARRSVDSGRRFIE